MADDVVHGDDGEVGDFEQSLIVGAGALEVEDHRNARGAGDAGGPDRGGAVVGADKEALAVKEGVGVEGFGVELAHVAGLPEDAAEAGALFGDAEGELGGPVGGDFQVGDIHALVLELVDALVAELVVADAPPDCCAATEARDGDHASGGGAAALLQEFGELLLLIESRVVADDADEVPADAAETDYVVGGVIRHGGAQVAPVVGV